MNVKMIKRGNRMKIGLALVSLLMLPALMSCSTAVLETKFDSREPGLKYYLPKTLVNIEIVPLGYDKDIKVAELDESERTTAIDTGQVRVKAVLGNRRHSVLVNKEGALVEPLITGLHLKMGGTPEKIVADADASLILQYQPSPLSTDRLCMRVDQDSLLSYVHASAKDETGNIIVSIAKAVGRFLGPSPFSASTPAQKPLDYLALKLQIDPLDRWDRGSVEDAIGNHFPAFRGMYRFSADDADYFLPRTSVRSAYSEEAAPNLDPAVCPTNHICYRASGPLRLSLKNRASGSTSVAYATVVNRAVTHKIDVTRAFMIEKVTLLNFKQGILSDVKIKKPSETLEAAKLPLTVYDAILTSALAAPGQFLGNLTPGMKADEYKTLISNYKQSIDQVSAIRKSLQDIREGDLTKESTQTETFALNCT